MKLIVAEGALLEQILDATHPVWSEGLTRQAYARWNAAQMRTPWGRAHLQRFALLDDAGDWVASAKRYRLPVRFDGCDHVMCGLGAVFTHPERRRRGYARQIVERLVEQEAAQGAALAGLFSEIGETFYQQMGFTTVPHNEVVIHVTRRDGSPAMLVRAGDDRDLPAIAAMHETRSAGTRLSLRRDASLIQYSVAKKRLVGGLGRPGVRHTEFFVAEEGASAVAYVVLTVTQHGWTLEEAGDRDPAGARLGAMLQVLLAREPTHGPPVIMAWWPPAFPVPPQWQITVRGPARDVFMVRPLTGLHLPSQPEDVFYWRSDHF